MALEPRIGFARAAHAVDDLTAFVIFFQKAVDGVDVILKVGIQGNDDIRLVLDGHKPGQERVLVAAVARKIHPVYQRVFPVVALDERPGIVLRAIVDVDDPAFLGDEAAAHQIVHFFRQLPGGFGQHFLFVVAGDDHKGLQTVTSLGGRARRIK